MPLSSDCGLRPPNSPKIIISHPLLKLSNHQILHLLPNLQLSTFNLQPGRRPSSLHPSSSPSPFMGEGWGEGDFQIPPSSFPILSSNYQITKSPNHKIPPSHFLSNLQPGRRPSSLHPSSSPSPFMGEGWGEGDFPIPPHHFPSSPQIIKSSNHKILKFFTLSSNY